MPPVTMSRVPPLKVIKFAIGPSAVADPKTKVPPLIVVVPVVLEGELVPKVSVPVSCMVKLNAPLMAPKVKLVLTPEIGRAHV